MDRNQPRVKGDEEVEGYVQVKEQDKTSEKVLTEKEINDSPVKEFKIMVIMMVT